ncbi:hypothetical protein QJS66_08070 [Kocuria rhizophila]|nr:hypothetical protein QJS66_08070 [Kocuria rhizophila]
MVAEQDQGAWRTAAHCRWRAGTPGLLTGHRGRPPHARRRAWGRPAGAAANGTPPTAQAPGWWQLPGISAAPRRRPTQFAPGLDRSGTDAAMLHACTLLFRVRLRVRREPPENSEHSALATPDAHVLRRLVDRYGSEVCLAPRRAARCRTWRRGTAQPPTEMETSGRRASAYERGIREHWRRPSRSQPTRARTTVVDLKDGSRGTIATEPAAEQPQGSRSAPGSEHRGATASVDAGGRPQRVRTGDGFRLPPTVVTPGLQWGLHTRRPTCPS